VTAARSVAVTRGVAWRSTRKLIKNPPFAITPIVIPLFFFAAFSGALSALGDNEDFKYYDFTAFEFVFVFYLAAMFVGIFTSFEIANDYAIGMGRRFMSAAPRRMAIVAGYLVYAFGRAVIALAIVWGVALATGMPVRGDAIDIAGLAGLALLLNLATTLYGAGIALRFQSTAAGVLVLIPVFMAVFLTPVFTERGQLSGWLKTAADINPLTAVMESGRGFLADDPVSVGIAFAAAGGLVIVFTVWAVFGMRKAEKIA
jgi:ABC-2 type transport system permease protein